MTRTLLPLLAEHSWLHFYQMSAIRRHTARPRVLVRGQGVHVWDESGARYIDALSGAFCVNVGYGREEILKAAHAAASSLHFASPFSVAHPWGIELAVTLSELAAPVLGREARVFFTNSGSEAVDAAIKMARACQRRRGHTSRTGIVSRNFSYHGTTFGALSASGFDAMRADFGPLLQCFYRVPATLCSRCELGLHRESCDIACAASVEAALATDGGNSCAAVLLEPMQNCGGNIPPPEGYLQRVAAACRSSGALLIVDEAICGFGRLGAWFGSQRYGMSADVLVCAKGLTSGYESLGAVIVRQDVADTFLGDDDVMFAHGATFGGRPSATAAASAAIEIIRHENLCATARDRGEQLRSLLLEQVSQLECVGEIRSEGLLFGIDLIPGGQLTDNRQRLEEFTEDLARRGVIACLYSTRSEPVLELAPPLIISDDECLSLVRTIRESLLATLCSSSPLR